MMTRKHSMIGALALVLLAFTLLFAACGTGDTASVPLTHSFNEGDSWTYEITVAVDGSFSGSGAEGTDDHVIPGGASIKMLQSTTVDDVTDDVATVTARTEILEVDLGDDGIDLGPEEGIETITMRIDNRGRILSVSDSGGRDILGGSGPGAVLDINKLTGQMGVVFPPSGSAEVGKEWSETVSLPIPGFTPEVAATLKAKVVAVETVDGRELATIDYTIDMPMDLDIDLWEAVKETAPFLEDSKIEMALRVTSKGLVEFTGTTRVDTANGQTEDLMGEMTIDLEWQITEAPSIVPMDQRGPVSMDLQVKLDIVRK